MQPEERGPSVAYRAFDADLRLPVVVGILASLGWDNFLYDPDLTRRLLTATGVTAIVATAFETGEVVGFVHIFSDGVFQAHLGLLAVDEGWHRRGIGRGLVEEAFERVGAWRMDLIASLGREPGLPQVVQTQRAGRVQDIFRPRVGLTGG